MALFGKGNGRGHGRGKDDTSGLLNAAKTLLANIRFISVDDPVRTIAITSAVPNEGKTFVTANLASAIATSGKTVLLVECDMRRRSMAHMLETHAQHGIYAVLSGELDLTEAAIETHVPHMYFLDAEPHIPNPSDLLNSGRFAKFVDYAKGLFDYVVFDTPPVGTFVDAAVLGTKVDAVFMVVREGFTKKHEVAAAAEQLRKAGCNLAGVVMNYCERKDSGYYYEYYYTHEDGRRPANTPTASMLATGEALEGMEADETGDTRAPLPKRPERPARSAAVSSEAAASGERESTGAAGLEGELEAQIGGSELESTGAVGRYPIRGAHVAGQRVMAPVSTPAAASLADEEDDLAMDTGIYERLAERARASWRRDDEF